MSTEKKTGTDTREVSYTCSYVPVEIIMAAGLVPQRMIPEPRPSAADAYIHPNTCYHVKSLLAAGLEGDVSRTAGMVLTSSCDGMRRLHDLWEEYVKDSPAVFLDIPKKKDPDSVEFFASELRRFAQNLKSAEADTRAARAVEADYAAAIATARRAATVKMEKARRAALDEHAAALAERRKAADEAVGLVHEEALKQVEAQRGEYAAHTPEMVSALAEVDNPQDVLYHLGNNKDQAADIAALSPAGQAIQIAKLAESVKVPPKPNKQSAAPDPIDPVGSTGSGEKPLEKMSFAEHEAHMNKKDQGYSGGW